MTLVSLPNEVLSFIVNELDSLKDIHAVASTSQHLQDICNSGCILSRKLYELFKPTVPHVHRHMLLAAVKARQLADATEGSWVRKLMLNDAIAWGIKGLCDLALDVSPLTYRDLRAVLSLQEDGLAWAEAFVEEKGNKVPVEAIKGLTSSAEDISSSTPMHRSLGEKAALNTKQIRVEYFENCIPEGDNSCLPDHADYQLDSMMITLLVLTKAVGAALGDPSKVGPLDTSGHPEDLYVIGGRLQDCIVHRGLDSIQTCVVGKDLKPIQTFVTAVMKAWRAPEYNWRSITYDIGKVKPSLSPNPHGRRRFPVVGGWG